MPRSTYYFEINKVDKIKIKNSHITDKITQIFNLHKGRYGVRRVYMDLVNQGYVINHKRVQRIMHELRLFGKRSKEKYHSYKGEVGKVADNIINRDFKADRPLQKWTTDVSEFKFSWGKCYISPILDMYTNEIISYDLSLRPNLKQISNMLEKAFIKFPKLNNLILHSDQGWQYQHKYYVNELKKHGIRQSMSRKGNCYDNSIMETFFGRLKNEIYYGYEKSYSSFEEFSRAIEEYIDYYNSERIQSKTKWMPPTKYRLASAAFYRTSLPLILVLVLSILEDRSIRINLKELFYLIIASIFFVATSLTLYRSYNFISSGIATTIHFAYPIIIFIIFIINTMITKSKPNKIDAFCLLMVTVGLILIIDFRLDT